MKNVTKFLTAAFVIGIFCTINLSAQENEKPVGPVKGAVIKGGRNGQVTFCWSSDENAAASFRLKVWQLKQGQTVETAMKTNQPIVAKDNNNNKNPELMRNAESIPIRGTDSSLIKVCSENLQKANETSAEHAINTKCPGCPDKVPTNTAEHAINTKGAGANDRAITNPQTTLNPVYAFTVDDFPACAEGASCDYVFTVEALNAAGNPVNPNVAAIPVKFGWNVKVKKL